jgi:glutathione peroxidase
MSIYDFQVQKMNGEMISLSQFRNQVLLIVNTATHCGYTKQYHGLQMLHETFSSKGLTILDFPSHTFNQTPENDGEIASFCSINFKTTFKPFAKIEVNGNDAHPLYQFLRKANSSQSDIKIEWNFTKFLVNRQGIVVNRYNAKTTPEMLIDEIQTLLG